MSRWEFSSGSDEPDRGDRSERSDDFRGGMAWLAEQPDADERQQAWEESRTHMAHAALDMLRQKVPTTDDGGHRYDTEIPRLTHLWIEHEDSWPAVHRDTILRAEKRCMSPEQHAAATDTIDGIREAEPAISADLQVVDQDNTSGAKLVGFHYRLKGEDRLKEKVAEQLAREPAEATADVVRSIPDAVRYTFCIDQASYAKGYHEIKERLESRGYEMYRSRNSWSDAEYKGVNTRWITPDGVRFEVQFHTAESFYVKHYVTHEAYERIRDPRTSRAELRELEAFQCEVTTCIPVPEGVSDILDYKREGF